MRPEVVEFEGVFDHRAVQDDSYYPREITKGPEFRYGSKVVTIPKGFVTDFSSVPKPLWVLFPKGLGQRASTLHDYLYQAKSMSRKKSDCIFYHALRCDGVAAWRAWFMWAGVRAFGWMAWRRNP